MAHEAIDPRDTRYTTTGRNTGTSPLGLTTLIHAGAGDLLTIRNPLSGFVSLTVSPLAGGAPSSATLLIELVKAD